MPLDRSHLLTVLFVAYCIHIPAYSTFGRLGSVVSRACAADEVGVYSLRGPRWCWDAGGVGIGMEQSVCYCEGIVGAGIGVEQCVW